MKVLYLSYWSLSEGLTQSSVLPHLEVLTQNDKISLVIFVTIERNKSESIYAPENDKVVYHPLYSKNIKVGLINKISDFLVFSRELIRLIKSHEINHLLCRTSLSGSLGYLVSRKMKVPYSVESFEPHADYMLDAKVWNRWGLKYLFQKYWEIKILESAKAIVTVSPFYSEKIRERARGKVLTFGCAVDLNKFEFSAEKRNLTRVQLSLPVESVVGIYVGKFGDIYYKDEAFQIFKRCFDLIPDFRLILLTPNDSSWVKKQLLAKYIELEKCFVDLVPHEIVVNYLSAADFALSMVRPASVRKYCSPIKDGEYWANGLSILSADGIGEDSDIIKKEGVGAIFKEDMSNLDDAICQMLDHYLRQKNQDVPQKVAFKYRNFEGLRNLYDQLLND